MTPTYDDPEPCPECGVGDAEYGVHRAGCPSGYATDDEPREEPGERQLLDGPKA